MASPINEAKCEDEGASLTRSARNRNISQSSGIYESSCLNSRRFLVAIMLCIGFTVQFGMRCNIGAAIVRMTTNYTKSSGKTIPAEFDWEPETIGLVESCFYWTYGITQILGGVLATMYPPHKIFMAAIVSSGCLNMLFPFISYWNIYGVFALRLTQGVLEASAFPACHGILSIWSPPLERTKLSTLAYSGNYIGVVMGMLLSNVISDMLSWHYAFYAYGVSCIIWGISFAVIVKESPRTDPSISQEELKYFEQSFAEEHTAINSDRSRKFYAPWWQIVKSTAFHAIIVANFARTWTMYLLVLDEPTYFHDMFELEKYENDILLAIPHLLMAFVVPLGGLAADGLRQKELMSTTTVRKLFNCGGFGLTAIFLYGVAFSIEAPVAITLLTLAVGFSGFGISGYNANNLDIAPRFASLLQGISNGIGTFSVAIVPVLNEVLVSENGAVLGWRYSFIIAASIHVFGVIYYAIFATGEKQYWADWTYQDHEHLQMDGIREYGTVTEKDRTSDTNNSD